MQFSNFVHTRLPLQVSRVVGVDSVTSAVKDFCIHLASTKYM